MSSSPESPTVPSPPVGVAVLGCGRVSDAHLEAIRTRPAFGRLEAVIDTDPSRAESAASRHGAPRALTSLDAALEIDAIEAIVVCLPNHLHGEPAIAALNAGRHVLVEKPMADSAEEAARMGRAAELNTKVLAIGQSRRHTRAIRYVADNLATFGRLRALQESFCIRWDGPQTPWWAERTREQGLVLSLIAPHSLDFVQLIMGADDPLRVHAESVRHRSEWQADDEAMILLRYPHERLVSVHLSYNQRPHFDRKVLLFDGCVVEIEDDFVVRVDGKTVVEPGEGELAEMARPALQFTWQFEEFAKAVRGLPNRSVLHPEGVRLMHTVDAAKRAALTGETQTLTRLPGGE